MKNTYTIHEYNREKVQKLVTRYQKKAEKYGIPMAVEYGATYIKAIPVYEMDGYIQTKVDEVLYEVFDLTIESQPIRKDGYTVAARIEHLEGGNIVIPFGCELRREWTAMKPYCAHCKANHGQRVTFIVRHKDGSEKQVGRTCLRDYCGIDPQAIGWANELNELLIGEYADQSGWDEGDRDFHAYRTSDALALAVMVQRTKGYTSSSERDSNKEAIASLMQEKERAPQGDYDKAEQIAAGILGMTQDEAYAANLNNVKALLEQGYCKASHFGYIAYAPLAYERYMQRLAEKAKREASASKSEYVGEIGQRMEIEVKEMNLVTSWEGEWGCTYLYKIVDKMGNVLIWYASRWMNKADPKKLKATVKSHSEYNGVKQTVLTRCSVVA